MKEKQLLDSVQNSSPVDELVWNQLAEDLIEGLRDLKIVSSGVIELTSLNDHEDKGAIHAYVIGETRSGPTDFQADYYAATGKRVDHSQRRD